jgi:hypothetical protein
MPDLTNFPALDVAIGLIVMYFVLSVVCSAINETLAMAFSWRAAFLEKGLKQFLTDEHRTKLLDRVPPDNRPAYIDPKVFSSTLMEILIDAGKNDAGGPVQKARTAVDGMEDSAIKTRLLRTIDAADQDVARVRSGLEEYFNATMDRVSGLYKRRVQTVMLVLAAVVALAANADTFHVANNLWKNPQLRSAVTSKANSLAQAGQQQGPTGPTGPTGPQGSTSTACDTSPQQCFEQAIQQVSSDVSRVKELNLPIGWASANSPHSAVDVVGKAAGLLVTIIALTMGAPFWFDALGRLARLRFAGVKPPTTSTTANNEPKRPPD